MLGPQSFEIYFPIVALVSADDGRRCSPKSTMTPSLSIRLFRIVRSMNAVLFVDFMDDLFKIFDAGATFDYCSIRSK